LLKVALDIHQILMLKNKIYKYLWNEIFKSFITILLTFTAIAWVVRAVNFLDLMVEDGYSASIYINYSLLNISTIMTRFVPLAFLLSLIFSIIKFEKQQEFLILWTSGIVKTKIVNVFLLVALGVASFQLILGVFVNPYLLDKSRFMLKNNEQLQVNSVLKSNEFIDSFKSITFYIDKKSSNNELLNIFIKDVGKNLNVISEEANSTKNSTIIAEKGIVTNGKLVLFNGIVQTLNKKNEIKNIRFEKNELSLVGLTIRTITQPKIQETSTRSLFKCLYVPKNNLNLSGCSVKNYRGEVVQNLSRRFGPAFYIPLVSVIVSFLLIYKKEKKYNFLKKYLLFFLSFLILVFAEIILKYTGFFQVIVVSYFVLPLIVFTFVYIYLIKKISYEKKI